MTHEELVEAVALFCAGSTAGGQRMRAEKVLAIAAAALKEPTEEMVRAAFVAPEYAVAPEGDGRLAAMFRAALSASPLFPKKDKADA